MLEILRTYRISIVGSLFGAFLLALAVQTLFIPFNLISGGVSGLAVIIYETLNVPTGVTFLVITLPIAIWAFYELRRKVFVFSIIGAVAINLWLLVFNVLGIVGAGFTFGLPMAAVLSGLLSGIGIGIIVNANSSSGGNVLLALILEKLFHFKVAITLLVIDVAVTLLGKIFYATWTETLGSLASTAVTIAVVYVFTHYFGGDRIRS
jgi:uncharacterized membrane-anchored protein YitT (DUF2179 family)